MGGNIKLVEQRCAAAQGTMFCRWYRTSRPGTTWRSTPHSVAPVALEPDRIVIRSSSRTRRPALECTRRGTRCHQARPWATLRVISEAGRLGRGRSPPRRRVGRRPSSRELGRRRIIGAVATPPPPKEGAASIEWWWWPSPARLTGCVGRNPRLYCLDMPR